MNRTTLRNIVILLVCLIITFVIFIVLPKNYAQQIRVNFHYDTSASFTREITITTFSDVNLLKN
ncbi:MAG: hypothetical protein ACRCTA_02560, partial [Bacilli bacterium]